MATITGLSLSGLGFLARASESQKAQAVKFPAHPGQRLGSGRMMAVRPVRAAPDRISEKVEESIKKAEETCSDNPASGECVAAWDEVEELSAAASHARDRKKESDPLENYCKDNPETNECRTYDN
ncbi:calvin cycle protein CP12-2, chloroplastic-like [Neltuma alba]|uniref:calvin cycle protein CP12-2, chloroplastic n=1 Tax=Neltuma alba TaxID=207710 RepID=UPI0010A3248F|nr:calvin cycle protein CP12-2, chloroplastic-like [Prosopis alba]XP_028797261.1 calvin cycle protein CP12-2, chloroplastic-like [Prosopis alba]